MATEHQWRSDGGAGVWAAPGGKGAKNAKKF